MKAGYVEEMLQWAESGKSTENPYILPIVEGIEAPLIKDLDAEAHERVKETVRDVGLRKNLNAEQMKKMRSRLLVPLLLRIRARVHHQVEVYVVSMLRRVILGSSLPGSGRSGSSPTGIASPSAGAQSKPSDDMQMEYELRDIDGLYQKGVLSKRDYHAQKAKVLSEWLGVAIKQIGGKGAARRALEDFLWPPVKTVSGCHCLLPFKYDVPELKDHTITYDVCTDIGSPGKAWCAVDPADGECGKFGSPKDPSDPKATAKAGGYGWSHWDFCMSQPAPHDEHFLPVPAPKVVTEKGCTCKLPFQFYPKSLGGLQKLDLYACTLHGGRGTHWCATEGSCGRPGTPESKYGDSRLSWTHWDKCVGEPAGFLALPPKPATTVQGCTCKATWTFEPWDLGGKRIIYNGCVDIDSPGTAWCAVEGDCGTKSADPKAGTKSGQYGWTNWDICDDKYQPTELVADLSKGILPHPLPYVRTESGCSCLFPFKIANAETNHEVKEFNTCQRFGMHAAWCPVNEVSCGKKSSLPQAYKGPGGFGWSRWDKCIGEPAGFLAPLKPKLMTRQGCVCKQPWVFQPSSLAGQEVTFLGCTDIGSPNQAWCAIDPVESPNCGIASNDPRAKLTPRGYGWDHWDYCMEQIESHEQGVMPYPSQAVNTLNGCKCKMPYTITPPGLGYSVTLTTCTRYGQTKSGMENFWWCPVEESSCGYTGKTASGKTMQWDKCVGDPPGWLEPEPVKTVSGCECLLPFEYSPPVLGGDRIVYTSCTDISTSKGGAWCATKGACGTKSNSKLAHMGPGGYGWTHWDICKEQPEKRPLIAGTDQLQLPDVVPKIRTQHGCTCRLPFQYSPADMCEVKPLQDSACQLEGGYMHQGWCVICQEKTFTECTRSDQDAAWCAVEGTCGMKSEDAKALNGEYGWTHWDHCIGEPAGYLPVRSIMVKDKRSSLSQQHASTVTVEKVVMKHGHKTVERVEEEGPSSLAKVASKGEKQRGRDQEMKQLEDEMKSSLNTLNKKLQQLDEESSAPSSSPLFAMAALCNLVVISFLLVKH
uniref:Uncharacterized protein n=1 Tax=Hanusia phi TaxID=3032 RepID=A0A7S0EG83_9CRYP